MGNEGSPNSAVSDCCSAPPRHSDPTQPRRLLPLSLQVDPSLRCALGIGPSSVVRLRGPHDRFHPPATSRRAIALATSSRPPGSSSQSQSDPVHPAAGPEHCRRVRGLAAVARHATPVGRDLRSCSREYSGAAAPAWLLLSDTSSLRAERLVAASAAIQLCWTQGHGRLLPAVSRSGTRLTRSRREFCLFVEGEVSCGAGCRFSRRSLRGDSSSAGLGRVVGIRRRVRSDTDSRASYCFDRGVSQECAST